MVKDLFLDNDKKHKIISCTDYSITAITNTMKGNYFAFIDAVLTHGRMED